MAKCAVFQFIDLHLDDDYALSDFGVCDLDNSILVSGASSPQKASESLASHLVTEEEVRPELWTATEEVIAFSDLGPGVRVVQVIHWINNVIAPPLKQPKASFWVFTRGGRVVLGRMATRQEALSLVDNIEKKAASIQKTEVDEQRKIDEESKPGAKGWKC
jgi:hypothetical protein